MHVPDGFLDLRTAGTTAALSLSALAAAIRRLRLGLPRRRVPLMGLAAAFIFAAQMLNFPVAGGTSGHLLGAVLASVLLGPSAAVVVMTAVLLVQCLLFADGGLLALGANVFNMAVVAVAGGQAVYRPMRRVLPDRRGLLVAAALASWCSTVLASIVCAAELAWSGVAAWRLVFPAMAGVHMLIGLGEAAITTLVVAAIMRTRPDLVELQGPEEPPSASRLFWAGALATTFGLVIFALPFASSFPDGLERVAQALGFAERAATPLPAPMPDYRLPGSWPGSAATAVAGVLGTPALRPIHGARRTHPRRDVRARLAVTPAVEVRGLAFRYAGREALRGIDLTVAPGECVGIVGPNGAGESTLLLHLNGILPEGLPSAPAVFIDGLPVVEKNLLAIRRKVGLLFQDPDDQIFCPTVFEDVAFGPEQMRVAGPELAALVAGALARVRLEGFEARSPHHLSLGEKRRVCLAGVLVCEPSLLVLDEPTSGLDPRGRRDLLELLRTLTATRVVASHDLDMVAALCSRVLVLDQGAIVACGPTTEVLGDEALMLAHGLDRPHALLHAHPHGA